MNCGNVCLWCALPAGIRRFIPGLMVGVLFWYVIFTITIQPEEPKIPRIKKDVLNFSVDGSRLPRPENPKSLKAPSED